MLLNELTVEEALTGLSESLSTNKAYLIRNDGKEFDSGEVHVYLSDPETIEYFSNSYSWANSPSNKKALNFLLTNTQYQNVKEEVKHIFNQDKSEEVLLEYCKNAYHNLNQEFLRCRFGGEYFYNQTKEIYFRISSQRFNWFDIIWNFVINHKKEISNITIEHDSFTFNDDKAYKLNGLALTHIDISTFLELPGNPIIEHLDSKFENNYFLNNLRAGKSIYESAETLPSHRARIIYESTFKKELIDYDLENCLKK